MLFVLFQVVRFWCPQSLAMKLTRKASSIYCVSLMTLLVSYGVIAEGEYYIKIEQGFY